MKKRLTCLVMVMMVVVGMAVGVPGNTVSAAGKNELKVTAEPKLKVSCAEDYHRYLLTVGEKMSLKVKYGKTNVTKKAKYKSSNNKVVSVTKTGILTPKKKGRATITVTYKGAAKKIKFISHKHEWTPLYGDVAMYHWQCDFCETYIYCGSTQTKVRDEAIQNHMYSHPNKEQSTGHYIKDYRREICDYWCQYCSDKQSNICK